MVSLSLVSLLESMRCNVVGTARDADSAVEMARTMGPDLVLMDVNLGGSDALAAARIIAEETGAEVVIVTAYSCEEVGRMTDTKAFRMLRKPVGERELAEVIAGVAGEVGSRRRETRDGEEG